MVAMLSPEIMCSIEEYFELEAKSLEKPEYFDGKITKMPGASYVHNRFVTNVLTALNVALINTHIEVNNSDTKGVTLKLSDIYCGIDLTVQ